MVQIISASFKDFIVNTLESYEGEAKFTHLKTEGMKICFDCSLQGEQGATLAKSILKGTKEGATMYFQVTSYE